MNKINFSDKMKVKVSRHDSVDEKTKVKTYCLVKQKSSIGSLGSPTFNYDSCSDQMTWLQNIVSDFQWYKMKKNDLFTNESSHKSKGEEPLKPQYKNSIRAIRIAS